MADYYRGHSATGVDGFEFKREGRGDHEIGWNPGTKVRANRRQQGRKSRPTKFLEMLAFPRLFDG
jgi:hypothetical protein